MDSSAVRCVVIDSTTSTRSGISLYSRIFDKAAFYGGTCLRLFHQLPRFSEDMDFSLLTPDNKFMFENYFQPIIDEFDVLGRKVEIKKKDKKVFGRVQVEGQRSLSTC